MINEQVKKLREYATYIGNCVGIPFGTRKILKDAANTIESLSARLEESKWIPCSDRLPEEPEVSPPAALGALVREGTLQEYIVMLYGALKPTTMHYAGNGEWYDQWTGEKYRVTAWRPLPEPYKQNNQAAVEKNRKTKPKMNEDIEEYLIEKKKMYQERITRLEKQEHDLRELLEHEPGREDAVENLNTVIKLQDRYNVLVDFIVELKESYL
jgi:Protein of unknown function (DUF551).